MTSRNKKCRMGQSSVLTQASNEAAEALQDWEKVGNLEHL